MLNTSKKHSIFLNGYEVLRVEVNNNEIKFYKVVENVAMKPTTKQDFMQTLNKLYNLNLVTKTEYNKIKMLGVGQK